MDNKIIAIIIAIIVVAVGAFLIFGGGGEEVTIGYLPSDHDAALFVADAQGKYAENGIKTKLVQFNNGGDLMTAMASGDVDVPVSMRDAEVCRIETASGDIKIIEE